MSTTIIANCQCGSIGRSDLRQCEEHHHIWRSDKRMVSIGRIIREAYPQKPCSSCQLPMFSDHRPGCPVKDAVDNARCRGDEVDQLLASYINGTLHSIPAGSVRQDSAALFLKAKRWFDKQHFKQAEAQLLLADDEVGGVCDFRFDGMLVDLKCTYDVSDTHELQVGGYAALDSAWTATAILHVTERYAEARLILLSSADICADFETLRQCWKMIQRRAA